MWHSAFAISLYKPLLESFLSRQIISLAPLKRYMLFQEPPVVDQQDGELEHDPHSCTQQRRLFVTGRRDAGCGSLLQLLLP